MGTHRTQLVDLSFGGTLVGTDDFTYNDLLRRTAATSRYGINNGWTYDDQGRMLTESTTVPWKCRSQHDGQTYNVGYRYDSRGRLDEITYPSGRKAAYTFDERSSIDLIQWDGSTIEDRGYDDLARLNATTRTGAAVDETRSYDTAGRLTGITNTNVGDASYTYDANHNKLSESWTGAMAAWNFVTTNAGANPQGYDAEDRFVHFAQAAQSKTFNFTRSDIGNINNINLNGTGTARGFSNIHALTTIGSASQTFDTDGNLTTNQFGHTNSWDEAGMMKQSVVPAGSAAGVEGTNEYGYDATQRRIFKKITRNSSIAEHIVYIHAGPNLIAEYSAGTAAASPAQEYVYAQEIDSLVMLVRSTGGGSGNEKLAITRNQQWSVTALTDSASGTVLERYTYDHFGKRTILESNGTTVRATSSYNMPFGYTSRQHDSETGLMYFRARFYDPHAAEFISPDPLEYVDGKSLYRGYFVMAGSDPYGLVTFFDASGWWDPFVEDLYCDEPNWSGNFSHRGVTEKNCSPGTRTVKFTVKETHTVTIGSEISGPLGGPKGNTGSVSVEGETSVETTYEESKEIPCGTSTYFEIEFECKCVWANIWGEPNPINANGKIWKYNVECKEIARGWQSDFDNPCPKNCCD